MPGSTTGMTRSTPPNDRIDSADHRTHRQRQHRQHRRPAGRRRGVRRRAEAEQLPRIGNPVRPGRRARPASLGRHRAEVRRARRHRRGDDPAEELPGRPDHPADRQDRHRHQQLLPAADGNIAELDSKQTTVSELLQAHLPSSHLVKAFNHIRSADLASQGEPSGRRALAIAGDDPEAKTTVAALIETFPSMRCRLAAALARAWAYGGDAARGVEFAVEAADHSCARMSSARSCRCTATTSRHSQAVVSRHRCDDTRGSTGLRRSGFGRGGHRA